MVVFVLLRLPSLAWFFVEQGEAGFFQRNIVEHNPLPAARRIF